jgi:predicted acyl esterase
VTSLGRTSAGATTQVTSAAWPPPSTKPLTLHLGRSFDTIPGVPSNGPAGTTGENGILRLAPQNTGNGWTHTDPGTVTEEMTLRDPINRARDVNGQAVRSHGYNWLYHESEVLTSDVRIAGSAVLDAVVNASTASQQVDPLLVEVLPDGSLTLVERGFLNLDYRNGLTTADPKTGWLAAKVSFLPQDYTFKAGSRIGLILQGSNTVWALPGSAGALSYAMGPMTNPSTVGTRLVLPVVGLTEPTTILSK